MSPIQNYLPRVGPLNDEDDDELITFLKEIVEHEHEFEDARIQLAL